MRLDPDVPEPRPWSLLVVASVMLFIGFDHLDNLGDPDTRELAVGGLGFGALCLALFFSRDLREFIERYWPPRL
jgi:hypothetical protein